MEVGGLGKGNERRFRVSFFVGKSLKLYSIKKLSQYTSIKLPQVTCLNR